MQDKILLTTAFNNEVRIYLSYTKNLVEEARVIHSLEPTSLAALGRLLTALSMMQYMYKDVYFLSLKIEGDGPIKYLITESLKKGTVRGCIGDPNVHINYENGKLAVGNALGEGLLTVKRMDNKEAIYNSSVKLISGEIAEDLTNYFLISEQTPSSVGLGVLVDVDKSVKEAGGFIVQLLPNASEETITKLETNLSKITSVTSLLEEHHSLEYILNIITGGDYHILSEENIKYECGCNKDYYLNVFAKLDDATLNELKLDKSTEVVCHYCNKSYHFDDQDFDKVEKIKDVLKKEELAKS